MELILSSLMLFMNNPVNANTVRIAVIDTGYNTNKSTFKLCNEAYDLTGEGIQDKNGHGQHISTIIGKGLKNSNYCIIPIKYWTKGDNWDAYLEAWRKVVKIKPDIVNISAGGPRSVYETGSLVEARLVREALYKGIIIVAAAGNDGNNLDNNCYYYPACIDNRIITVGALGKNYHRLALSNYGDYVKHWELGTITADKITMTGTSQATALKTNKIAKILIDKRIKNCYIVKQGVCK